MYREISPEDAIEGGIVRAGVERIFEIRRVTNTSRGESDHVGHVVAPTVWSAQVRACDGRFGVALPLGGSFYTIPTDRFVEKV
jgi:hypothetical protein